MKGYLLLAVVVHSASCFSQQRYAVLSPNRASSNLILRVIDEAAVAAAVKWNPPPVIENVVAEPVQLPPTPPPPPPPPALSTTAIEEDVVVESVKLPPVPPPPPPAEITPIPIDTSLASDVPFASIAIGLLGAFAVGTFAMRREREAETAPPTTTTTPSTTPAPAKSASVSSVDVSIPYDAAALLAYDEWRVAYGKGSFDEAKFAIFKDKYIKVTVSNVLAKKVSRDTGTPAVLSSLDEKADQA